MDEALKAALQLPAVRLHGEVGGGMLDAVMAVQTSDISDIPLVVELMTSGGDADYARRIAMDLAG